MFFPMYSLALRGWESDDDADMDDEDSIVTALGCLGPLGGLLAPEIQRYQKHLKGLCLIIFHKPKTESRFNIAACEVPNVTSAPWFLFCWTQELIKCTRCFM